MKKCPFCAEEIQAAAIVCKHCGRDVVTKEPTQPRSQLSGRDLIVKPTKTKTSGVTWAVLVVIVLAVLAGIAGREPDGPSKALDVSVARSATAVDITNVSTPEAVGGEMIVYINGDPPFTYRANATVPAVGGNVRLPLNSFVTKNGDRFNPVTQAVTVVWVGGGGYDYKSFKW